MVRKKETGASEFFLFFFLALFTQKATNRQSTSCQIRFYSKGFENYKENYEAFLIPLKVLQIISLTLVKVCLH